jgi:hypothetical protein
LLERGRRVALVGKDVADLELLVARGDARFGQEDRRQIADLIAAPARAADRHPFFIGAHGGGFARAPVALVGLVIFGPALPGVIGKFMIVPLRDDREQLVKALQIGIAAIGGIA